MFGFIRAVPKKRTIKYNKNKGILYNNLSFWNRVFFYTATFGFILSFLFVIYWFYPIGKAYFVFTKSRVGLSSKQQEVELVNIDRKIQSSTAGKEEYSINIPKIQASANIATSVSPFDPAEYIPILDQDKVAQAKLSSYPGSGRGKMTYIFAHSSNEGLSVGRKNPVFYLLGELIKGDSVWITYQGKKYLYKVYDKKIITANDTQYLEYQDKNREVLILQTCWPIGTDWKRLLVFAELLAY